MEHQQHIQNGYLNLNERLNNLMNLTWNIKEPRIVWNLQFKHQGLTQGQPQH